MTITRRVLLMLQVVLISPIINSLLLQQAALLNITINRLHICRQMPQFLHTTQQIMPNNPQIMYLMMHMATHHLTVTM